jgi:hypothetical protein
MAMLLLPSCDRVFYDYCDSQPRACPGAIVFEPFRLVLSETEREMT